jgi:F-type H+-transporting ATPase subunit c
MKKFGLALFSTALLPALALAEEGATAAVKNNFYDAALCIAIPAAIVGFSQSRAATAALEGIGRNPAAAKSLQTPLILSLALMESLVLLAFVIALIK